MSGSQESSIVMTPTPKLSTNMDRPTTPHCFTPQYRSKISSEPRRSRRRYGWWWQRASCRF